MRNINNPDNNRRENNSFIINNPLNLNISNSELSELVPIRCLSEGNDILNNNLSDENEQFNNNINNKNTKEKIQFNNNENQTDKVDNNENYNDQLISSPAFNNKNIERNRLSNLIKNEQTKNKNAKNIKDENKGINLQINNKNKDLKINQNKEYSYNPGDTFEFLGFSFEKDIVDLSSNTVYKIKRKIRRSARGMRRWSINKGIDFEVAIKAMNKKFNRKFYGSDDSELTWRFWFFPSINTIKSLELIDHYYQDELRYIVTGKHNKKNFKKVPYIFLKDCNYKSLVHEYYELKLNMENNFHR